MAFFASDDPLGRATRDLAAARKRGPSSTGGSRPSSDRSSGGGSRKKGDLQVYLRTTNKGLRTYGTGGARPAHDRPGLGGGFSSTEIGGERSRVGRSPAAKAATKGKSIAEDVVAPLDDAVEDFYDWTDQEVQTWAEYCVALGILDEDKASDPEELFKAWKDAVEHAAHFYKKGRKVTPFQAAAWMASTDNWGRTAAGRARNIAAAGAEGGAEELFTGKKTRTVRTINLTDPATARAMVNSQLTQLLGRRATDEEVDEFTETLNAYERKHPTIQRTTDTYKDGELVDTKNVQKGGVSDSQVNEMIEDDAMSLPEYGAFQAATTYYDAFRAAIGAPV